MDKPLLIVGTGLQAEQAHFYFATLGARRVQAFLLDAAYLREPQFLGRPVIETQEALCRFGPDTHELFIAIGFAATEARKRWFLAARSRGYTMPIYVHPSASVAANVTLGPNTLVQELSMISPFARVGDNVFLCPQVGINHHTRVGPHCFFAPGVVVAGDAEIGERCFIGAGAVIRDRVRVGEACVIGAGALIMGDCEAGGVYPGPRTGRRV